MKKYSIGNGKKSETKTSTSSHCRINQKKIKAGQILNNVKTQKS